MYLPVAAWHRKIFSASLLCTRTLMKSILSLSRFAFTSLCCYEVVCAKNFLVHRSVLCAYRLCLANSINAIEWRWLYGFRSLVPCIIICFNCLISSATLIQTVQQISQIERYVRLLVHNLSSIALSWLIVLPEPLRKGSTNKEFFADSETSQTLRLWVWCQNHYSPLLFSASPQCASIIEEVHCQCTACIAHAHASVLVLNQRSSLCSFEMQAQVRFLLNALAWELTRSRTPNGRNGGNDCIDNAIYNHILALVWEVHRQKGLLKFSDTLTKTKRGMP